MPKISCSTSVNSSLSFSEDNRLVQDLHPNIMASSNGNTDGGQEKVQSLWKRVREFVWSHRLISVLVSKYAFTLFSDFVGALSIHPTSAGENGSHSTCNSKYPDQANLFVVGLRGHRF